MLISIEGNIGSGKSTFCKYLKDHLSKKWNLPSNRNIYFVDEPVDIWETIKDCEGNLIEHFYKNPEKYAFCFQMTAYISRLAKLKDIIEKAKSDDIIIMERCVYSDYNVFALMLYNSGKINEIEFQCYNMWFEYFQKEIPSILFIYIKTDFNNCYDRITQRNRQGENEITKIYLEQCEKYHENWLNKEVNKITLDGNKDTNSHPEYCDIVKQIMCYKLNVPENFDGNDSDNEHYYEYRYETSKWNKRLFNKTLEQCNKRAKNNIN